MHIKTASITALLAAGAAAAAIVAAPTAAADAGPLQTACSSAGPATECVSPGNAEINDSLPPDFAPQYPDFSLFGFGGRGGGHR